MRMRPQVGGGSVFISFPYGEEHTFYRQRTAFLRMIAWPRSKANKMHFSRKHEAVSSSRTKIDLRAPVAHVRTRDLTINWCIVLYCMDGTVVHDYESNTNASAPADLVETQPDICTRKSPPRPRSIPTEPVRGQDSAHIDYFVPSKCYFVPSK